jgi:hypothetical protein
MKKLFVFFVLLTVILIACDLSTNSDDTQSDTIVPEAGEMDTAAMLFIGLWVKGDTMFFFDCPEHNRAIDDTVIHFYKRDSYGIWAPFLSYLGGKGSRIYEVTNSSFEACWLCGDMITVHYEIGPFDENGLTSITVSYPGYKETFLLDNDGAQ